MADDFRVDFSGDDRDLIKVIERQQKKLNDLEGAYKKVGQSAAKGAGDITKGFDALGRKLASVGFGLQFVQKGVGLVTDAYAAWNERLKQVLKTQDEVAQKTLEALSAGDQLANRDKVVSGLAGGAVPIKDSLEAYKAAAGAGRGKVADDRLLAIARGAGAGAVAGLDANQLAERAARLAALDKNKSVDDLLDMAAKMTPEQAEQLAKPGSRSLLRNKDLRAAARGDYFSRRVQTALNTPEGRRFVERQARERDLQSPDAGEVSEADWQRRGEEWIDRRVRGQGPIGELKRMAFQTGVYAIRFLVGAQQANEDAIRSFASSGGLNPAAGEAAVQEFINQDVEINRAILKELQTIRQNGEIQGSRTRGVVPDNRHGEN